MTHLLLLLSLLGSAHPGSASICVLREILKTMGPYGRKNESDTLQVASSLNDQLEGPEVFMDTSCTILVASKLSIL